MAKNREITNAENKLILFNLHEIYVPVKLNILFGMIMIII